MRSTASRGRVDPLTGPGRAVRATALGLLLIGPFLPGCSGPEDRAPATAAVSGGAATAAAAPQAEKPPERGDWLVLHLLSDPENLNPLTSSDAAADAVLNWIFPTLLRLDNETLEQQPFLARELPEVSADKLQYTFRLRDGATFSDGTPVTAQDLLFTIQAIKNPFVLAPHRRNYLESVRDAQAPDAHTLRVELRRPYFRNDLVLGGLRALPRHYYDPENLMEDLSIAELESAASLPSEKRERAKRFGDQFNSGYNRRPLGAGAFAIRDPERDIATGSQITLHRRPDYWAPDDSQNGDGWVQRVVFRVVNDSEAALASFKRQELDRLNLTPIQYRRPDTQTASFTKRAERRERVAATYTYVGWNERRPLFQDARLRRALGHFVDKQSLVQSVLLGLGQPVESPVLFDRPEYNQALAPYPYDPALGKRLLAEAGWNDSDGDGVLDKEIDGVRVPLRFEIISNSGNEQRRLTGLAVIDQLKRAGVDASFRQIDWSIMLGKVKTFDYDAVILGWALNVTSPDLYQIWHSSQAVEGGSNHVAFKNAEVDKLLEAYREEFDFARRKQMYDRVQEILYQEQPYTFLFIEKAVDAWDRRFQGVRWYERAKNTDMREWWVPQAEQRYSQ